MRFKTTIMLGMCVLLLCVTVEAKVKATHIHKPFSVSRFMSGRQVATPPSLNDLQQQTLDSIEKIDDYPAYLMVYYADYEFDDYLKTGRQNLIEFDTWTDGCSSFATHNPEGERIYGRNLDLAQNPVPLFVFCSPEGAYKSVSLSYGIYIEDYLANPTEENAEYVLAYPYLPSDGMNECGVCVAGMNLEIRYQPNDPNKVTLGKFETRRLILDYAHDLDSAIALVQSVNTIGADDHHLLVSDAYGNSAIIEFENGEAVAYRNQRAWQAATNFRVHGGDPDSFDGYCWRYTTVHNSLRDAGGKITAMQGMDILSSVSRRTHEPQYAVTTYWSTIYDQLNGDHRVCIGEDYETVHHYVLEMGVDLAASSTSTTKRSVSQGRKVRLETTVTNEAARSSKATNATFYLSKKPRVNKRSILLGSSAVPALDALASTTVRWKGRVPKDMRTGLYNIIVVVDPDTALRDYDRADNTHVSTQKLGIN